MPELPEVETVRKTLESKLKNKTILDINIIYPKLIVYPEITELEKEIKNQKIIKIDRMGKWLIFKLSDFYLLSHLRMEGKYLFRNTNDVIEKHELVTFTLDNNQQLRYKDVRKFGKMYLFKEEELNSDISPLKKLGLEPWDINLNVKYLTDKFTNKNIPIKTVLLDQTIITGIGNIYADEILFLSGINPWNKAKDLSDRDLEKIINNTKKVLEKAIEKGGTTIRSYTSEEGVTGKFQNDLLVHQKEKEPCPKCKSIIKKDKIGGRSSYYCPKCQI